MSFTEYQHLYFKTLIEGDGCELGMGYNANFGFRSSS